MALLRALFKGASSPTDRNRKLITAGITDKLAGLLLHVLGGARGLVHSPALLGTLPVAHLLNRLVALFHCLIVSLLLECNRALLFKVLLAHLLLAGGELGDIGVVALLHVLVGALQDGLLLQAGHGLLLLLSPVPRPLVVVVPPTVPHKVGGGEGQQAATCQQQLSSDHCDCVGWTPG